MPRTKRMIDGKGYEVPINKIWRFQCCDCGLVHDVVIAVDHEDKENAGFAVRRNKRATAAARRGKVNAPLA